jgi:hypothetical protein
MMNTTAQKPATTPVPVQLSAPECTAFIFSHLSMPKRGPKCTLSYHRLFNLIFRESCPGLLEEGYSRLTFQFWHSKASLEAVWK